MININIIASKIYLNRFITATHVGGSFFASRFGNPILRTDSSSRFWHCFSRFWLFGLLDFSCFLSAVFDVTVHRLAHQVGGRLFRGFGYD